LSWRRTVAAKSYRVLLSQSNNNNDDNTNNNSSNNNSNNNNNKQYIKGQDILCAQHTQESVGNIREGTLLV
jgi:hypothetical protein